MTIRTGIKIKTVATVKVERTGIPQGPIADKSRSRLANLADNRKENRRNRVSLNKAPSRQNKMVLSGNQAIRKGKTGRVNPELRVRADKQGLLSSRATGLKGRSRRVYSSQVLL